MTKTAAKPRKVSEHSPKNRVKTAKTAEKQLKSLEIAPIPTEECSILKLSRLFNLDRASVRDRLEKAGIKPVSVKSNEKLYALDETLESVLRQDELAEAKLEKLRLEGEKLAHDLAVKRGEFASVAEFTEITQKIFGRLHKKVVVQLPKRIAKRLHDANSAADLMQVLETELAKEFSDLRSDFMKYLGDKK